MTQDSALFLREEHGRETKARLTDERVADRDALDLALYASVSQLWHVMRRFVFDPPYTPTPADDDRVVDDRPRNGDDGDDFGDPDARK